MNLNFVSLCFCIALPLLVCPIYIRIGDLIHTTSTHKHRARLTISAELHSREILFMLSNGAPCEKAEARSVKANFVYLPCIRWFFFAIFISETHSRRKYKITSKTKGLLGLRKAAEAQL